MEQVMKDKERNERAISVVWSARLTRDETTRKSFYLVKG